MSFRDDAIEPLAVESAQHFSELLRHAATRENDQRLLKGVRERGEPGRTLPRELGS